MGRRENYERQHKEIREVANIIKLEIEKNEIDFKKVALNLNKLAGQLNVHLKSEDNFLYPELEKNEDKKISQIAVKFDKEMGGIAEAFTEFKSNYNIAQKIENDTKKFLKQAKSILEVLFKRMEKEEKELYIYL